MAQRVIEFKINLRNGNKDLQFTVEHFDRNDLSEKFRIIARNKTIVLESNRPTYRRSLGFKKWFPKFTLLHGQITDSRGVDDLAKAIMTVLEPEIKPK